MSSEDAIQFYPLPTQVFRNICQNTFKIQHRNNMLLIILLAIFKCEYLERLQCYIGSLYYKPIHQTT